MLFCPTCGSENIYIHDRGWTYILRILSFNSRLVCRDCQTTWKRRTPEQFSKLKLKVKRRRVNKNVVYRTQPGKDCLSLNSPDKITVLVSEWQQEKKMFISLDMEGVSGFSTQELSNLMEFHRKLRAVGGDIIISNTSVEINNYLWSLNLGYLIASGQKIVP
jgi:hypothetical protein